MQHRYFALPIRNRATNDRGRLVSLSTFIAFMLAACSDPGVVTDFQKTAASKLGEFAHSVSTVADAKQSSVVAAPLPIESATTLILADFNTAPVINASVGGVSTDPAPSLSAVSNTSSVGSTNPAVTTIPADSSTSLSSSPSTVTTTESDPAQGVIASVQIPDRSNSPSLTTKQADEQALKQPAAFVLEDWSDGRGVKVAVSLIDNALPDLVFEDADLNSEMGTVKLASASKPIVMKGFEFGILRFTAPSLAESGGTLYQVLVAAKPSGTWPTFPYADTFNSKTNVTTPNAFKVRILNSVGGVIATIEMSDGKAINDKSLSQTRETGTGALRPLFNVGMMLPWQSERPRISSKLNKFHPGFVPFRESLSKSMTASNGSLPMLARGTNGRHQINGFNHWYQLPRWPLAVGAMGEQNFDSYSYNVETAWSGSGAGAQSAWISGWDYEPGSISGHDWFTGPGGMRFDRATIPTPLAHLISNKGYKRAKDLTPIVEMADSWGKAYFNHSGHYVTSLLTFNQILSSTEERRSNRQMGAYYGNGRTFAAASKSIDMRGVTNGSYDLADNNGGTDPNYFLDKNGNRFWNSWLIDSEHLHQTPYWHTILLNSPMHVVASRAAFNQSFLARLGSYYIDSRPTNSWAPGLSYAGINGRGQAYRWLHYTLMWKVSTQSGIGLNRREIEAQFIEELRNWHDTILVPTLSETKNPYHVALKRLGVGVRAEQGADGWYLNVDATSTQYYHAGTFLAMKNLGLWDRLRTDPKAKAVLDFVSQSMSKFSVDFMIDTEGLAEDPSGVTTVAGPFATFSEISADSVPTWKQWRSKFQKKGKESWLRDLNGNFKEQFSTQHLRAQWAVMMRDWFPELAYPRASEAAQLYEKEYRDWQDYVSSRVSPREKEYADLKLLSIPTTFFQKPK